MTASTLAVTLQAFAAACLLGVAAAIGFSQSRLLERTLYPYAVILQVTPVVAIAPLVLIWYGLDNTGAAVVTLAALVAFFPIFSGVLTGLRSADPDLERLFDLYGADRRQRLVRLRAPSAAVYALEGFRVAAGLSIIGAVVAEFVSGSGAAQGLAWRLLEAGNRLRTAELLAALAWLAVMGAALNAGAGLLVAVARRHLVGR